MKNKLIFSGLLVMLLFAVSVSAFDVCIDNTAPSAPANLVLSDSPYDADGIVVLSWRASTDPTACGKVAHYNIYRASNSSAFSKIAESTDLTYTDSGLTKGLTYSYKITAVDSVEVTLPNEGAASQTKSTTIGTAPVQGGGNEGGNTGGSGGGSSGGSGGSGSSVSLKAMNSSNSTANESVHVANESGFLGEGNFTLESNPSQENESIDAVSTERKGLLGITGAAIGDLFAKGSVLVGVLVMLAIIGIGFLLFLFFKRRKKKGKKHKW
jgi:hypothetical protein